MRGGKVFKTSSKWQKPKEAHTVTLRIYDTQTKQTTTECFVVECTNAEIPALYSSIVSGLIAK